MQDDQRTEEGSSSGNQLADVLRHELLSWGKPSLGEVATALLAAATVVVLMGAVVFWIRAANADLPGVQTLSLIPRQEFVIVGMRQLVAPMLAVLVLSIVSAGVGIAAATLKAKRQTSEDKRDEGGDSQMALSVGFGAFGLGIFLSGPFDWTTAVVSAAVLLYLLVIATPFLGLRAVLVLAALLAVSTGLAQEADSGTRFERASLQLEDGTKATGFYISATGGRTYIGKGDQIEGIPDRQIARIRIEHAPKNEPAPDSLADRLIDLIDEAI